MLPEKRECRAKAKPWRNADGGGLRGDCDGADDSRPRARAK